MRYDAPDHHRGRACGRQLDCTAHGRRFIIIIASLAWMIDGWLDSKASLVIQNGVLLLINVLGVWRWLPKAAKDMR
jgi:hypothetical protein